jgi:hypothetical protein
MAYGETSHGQSLSRYPTGAGHFTEKHPGNP